MSKRLVSMCCLLLLLPCLIYAQAEHPESQTVQLSAEDGLTLVGDYFAPTLASDEGASAILFVHQHGGNRGEVSVLAQPLIDAGYALLAVDLRGHGETGGDENWSAVTEDLQAWMDWLKSQPGIQPSKGLMTVGVAVGGNYALIACANEVECRTAVAISPLATGCEVVSCEEELVYGEISVETLTYIDTTTTAALSEGLQQRPALVLLSQQNFVADSAKYLVSASSGDVQANFFAGETFGMDFFGEPLRDPVTALVLGWLNEHP
jgi:pimeloyl-ACP methyl ester carboxylesterase